jgi:hypothetical protein
MTIQEVLQRCTYYTSIEVKMKAIARITKLKGGNLAASEQHTDRSRETPNADPNRDNQRLINVGDNDQTLMDMIRQRVGQQKYRKDAVLCVEMLLSVSPEYFRPDNPAIAGYWEPDKLERFQWAVQQWLTEKYGDRVLRAELHLDEATPHIHAYIIPLDDRDKLNCKGLFGSREKLRQWQDSYAKALEPLGVERGIRGSRATHTAIQEYYAAVMEEPSIYLDAATIQHQLADRRLLLKERNELEQTVAVLVQDNQALQQQVSQLQAQLRAIGQPEVKMPRLDTIASRLGLTRDKYLPKHWDRDGVTITGDTAIALCMQSKQWDVQAAALWMREQFGEDVAQRSMTEYVQGLFEAEPIQWFVAPLADRHQWKAVKAHLTDRCRLPKALVNRLYQQGLVYANAEGKAVFALRDLEEGKVVGALLYDLGTEDYEVVVGSRSQAYFYLKGGDRAEQVVLVDSPIEAMSKWVLDQPESQQRSYVNVLPLQDLPQDWLGRQGEVMLAFGRAVAEGLGEMDGEIRVLPKGESWSQDLQEDLRRRFEQGKRGEREVMQREQTSFEIE